VSEEEDDRGSDTVFVDLRPQRRKLKKSRLVVIDGPDRGRELSIDRKRVTIGRSLICDLVLRDGHVSGTHCELESAERGVLLRDLGSRNGTYLDEVRVKEAWLEEGSVIRVGQSIVGFETQFGHVDIELSKNESFHGLVGHSVRMREIFAVLEKIAPTDLTVLIRGETGTGKELVARAIHKASKRSKEPLVVQDCSAIPSNLIEDTLFGHEKGAFTGATDRYKGSFEQANGGTIFLDEIGELDLTLQPKLLRVLETREIKRVGGTSTVPVDVRVVAATNRDLRQMVNAGTFREDLYYRLSVVQVELPPLRERGDDIPLIVRGILDDFAKRRYPDEDKRFTVHKEAMARLVAYPWPGNVRELKNTVERAGSLSNSLELTVRDLTPTLQKTPPEPLPGGTAEQFVDQGVEFKEAKQRVIDAFEAAYLKSLLDKFGGNISRSAQAAGLTRYHLRALAKRYGIHGDPET